MGEVETQVIETFKSRYGGKPEFLVRAPGRVNLIGEHTDYNDGFVLPLAIDRAVWIALRPRADRQVVVQAIDMDEQLHFDLDNLSHTDSGWLEYIKGVAHVLQEEGFELQGWEGVMGGDVPIGAGLSSSAALELATARAFAAVSPFDWQPTLMAKLGQRAENQWVGMNCGIMDQMISASGAADHALLIDCRSLDTELVPIPAGTNVILDTATRRGLVGSAYNDRRRQCEEAAAFFKVPALRDVDLDTFAQRADEMDDLTMRRARHVISENKRTVEAAKAMKAGDAAWLGRLMDASHVSMRDDFEISGDELNTMVAIAQARPGCYGARMTGGGFAGCAVALVDSTKADTFARSVAAEYEQVTGLEPQIYICEATNGAELLA
jgi:galactokinase